MVTKAGVNSINKSQLNSGIYWNGKPVNNPPAGKGPRRNP